MDGQEGGVGNLLLLSWPKTQTLRVDFCEVFSYELRGLVWKRRHQAFGLSIRQETPV